MLQKDYMEQGFMEAIVGDYTVKAYLNSGVHDDYWSYEVYNVAGAEVHIEKSTNMRSARDCLVSGLVHIENFEQKYGIKSKNNK